MLFIKIYFQLLLILFLNGCSTLPGINENIKEKSSSNNLSESEYSIDDVKINIIKINNLSKEQLNIYSADKFNDLENNIKNFPEIYDYKYEYVLGPSDIIDINLTDTDDLDGTYEINEKGMIDLPFVGKVQLDELTKDEAHNLLTEVIKNYYQNPDLQININEYNSSKVFIVGAVRNQLTIALDQEPIKLIEAAIQANFNPSAQNKEFGTSGILRRDGKVYRINLNIQYSTFHHNPPPDKLCSHKNHLSSYNYLLTWAGVYVRTLQHHILFVLLDLLRFVQNQTQN